MNTTVWLQRRSVDDASLAILGTVATTLDCQSRILFVDLSSALNTFSTLNKNVYF